MVTSVRCRAYAVGDMCTMCSPRHACSGRHEEYTMCSPLCVCAPVRPAVAYKPPSVSQHISSDVYQRQHEPCMTSAPNRLILNTVSYGLKLTMHTSSVHSSPVAAPMLRRQCLTELPQLAYTRPSRYLHPKPRSGILRKRGWGMGSTGLNGERAPKILKPRRALSCR